jgi:ATP-binding cassette subfamily B protein
MNNASVEYVRGFAVVNGVQADGLLLRRLHETIKAYTNYVIPYTLSWENSMSGFLAVIHNIYLFLIPAGIWIGFHTEDYAAYALSFIFYLLFVPSISSVMTKIMYVSRGMMMISGGVERMDEILRKEPMPQPENPKTSDGCDIEFRDVSFSYDENEDVAALDGVSFTARHGEVTAIVGPSGSGKSTIAHLIPRFYDVTKGAILIGGSISGHEP